MKKRMMKLAAISMSVLMAASLGACGSGGGDDKSSGSDDSKKEESTASADESKGGDKEIVMWANGTEDLTKVSGIMPLTSIMKVREKRPAIR